MAEEKQCDLECVICFSIYNNVFRTPKQLACGHTFCLECLARMNMKSQVAENIQCPICRKLTTVPKEGLPKLGNDSTVLSCLPETMQRIQSIHFNRGKGRLFVKKGLGSQKKAVKEKIFVSSVSQSLDVGHPSEPISPRQHRGCWRCCLQHKFYLGAIFVITATLSVLIGSIWMFVVH
ncbi:RING finger protein 225-like [Mobula hypostoma]|uniref:RING finger protein 225-like n=1 Tax=Mobula hypostoma TaxID=723540 RepID=UPI002FC375F6